MELAGSFKNLLFFFNYFTVLKCKNHLFVVIIQSYTKLHAWFMTRSLYLIYSLYFSHIFIYNNLLIIIFLRAWIIICRNEEIAFHLPSFITVIRKANCIFAIKTAFYIYTCFLFRVKKDDRAFMFIRYIVKLYSLH